ncbi:hypothetical protein ACE38W_21325 [Chitinophaga sp. Hz27]|uniref:hypothetical protein n=1 Tax=Chitinophaga sp. Hz27 TaxID=3347169 RepID=UPI0035D92A81
MNLIKRISCCLFVLFATTTVTFAQNGKAPVTDITVDILNWVKHLDSGLDKYYTSDKSRDLYDNFGYLKQELTEYLNDRKKLSDSLFRNNVKSTGKQDPAALESLRKKMTYVMGRMRDVTDLTNNDLRAEGDKLNDKIYNILTSEQPQYLSNLEAFLAGYEVTQKDIAIDGSAKTQRLAESVNLITSIQARINRKK